MKGGYKKCWRAEAGAKQGWDELPKKGVIVPLMYVHISTQTISSQTVT